MNGTGVEYTTSLKRAQGRGSGREGTHHHWQMILSSIAMVFAVPALVITFGLALGRNHGEVTAFFTHPVAAITMAVALTVCIRHFMHETLEAIEDYVHGIPGKLAMFSTTAISYLMIIVALFALAKIAL
ncbi:MAG: succinate dehydrogenase, hydrophobic membrane anchor protein [Pseudomonadota bacterium]